MSVGKKEGKEVKHLPKTLSLYARYFKRGLDIFVALLGILVFSLLYALLALLVAVKMGRPIIFSSERIGKDEKVFMLHKFRSMTNAVDETGVLLPGPQRMTSFGRLLRSSSLDELPSLWNILKGDMSLVGPRPMPKKYAPYFYPQERERHRVRPGLTGWSQVNGRNLLSWEEKFSFDLYYLQHLSFGFDLKILLKTVGKVLKRADIVQGAERSASLYEVRAFMTDSSKEAKEGAPHAADAG